MNKPDKTAEMLLIASAMTMECPCLKCAANRALPDNRTPPSDLDGILTRAALIVRAIALSMHDSGTGNPRAMNRPLSRADAVTLFAAAEILLTDDPDAAAKTDADADADKTAAHTAADFLATFTRH